MRRAIAMLGVAVLLCGSIATMMRPPQLRLLWNASASAPVGLWTIDPDATPGRGDMVAARLAQPWRGFAARRHYLPANVPLIKRVAAVSGDHICANDHMVFVNGEAVAARRRFDAAGRAMPVWHGCKLLGDAQILLLIDAPNSFDGRYFGVTLRRDIIGKAVPLWLR
ncbi:S26 family signal peptidase [Sphingopyxis sp. MWB1]|uniref:S26 family signal peptidase n=1 Tax=Sphingopyxis sp. MWB1 TaxID=1537715 RepID=UPI0009DDD38B|nr:S26 family signal peptidase [Sphingopyxis sp. MWB1]